MAQFDMLTHQRCLQKSVADAMRELLESFRLPGESQQIERITGTFAKCFFASEPGMIYIISTVPSYKWYSGDQEPGCSPRVILLDYYAQYGPT